MQVMNYVEQSGFAMKEERCHGACSPVWPRLAFMRLSRLRLSRQAGRAVFFRLQQFVEQSIADAWPSSDVNLRAPTVAFLSPNYFERGHGLAL